MSHGVAAPKRAGLRDAAGLPGLDPVAWPDVAVVEATGSTNADLVARAHAGARGPAVLIARSQHAGRGRLGRSWDSPPGTSLAVSVLLAPGVPPVHWGWLPLLTGLATRDALAGFGVVAGLKWPNDVLVVESPASDPSGTGSSGTGSSGTGSSGTGSSGTGSSGTGSSGTGSSGTATGVAHDSAAARYGGRKVAGILVEGVADAGVAVAGIGVNVAQGPNDLPVRHATSLRMALAPTPPPSPDLLAAALLRSLAGRLADWRAAGGQAGGSQLAADYRAACVTLGRRVRVDTRVGSAPGGPLLGRAVDVSASGALVLRVSSESAEPSTERLVTVVAGDVEHVR